jgi:hypothetical protein
LVLDVGTVYVLGIGTDASRLPEVEQRFPPQPALE